MENIKNKYIDKFFSELTENDKLDIYFYQFMWHAFSYKVVDCIEGAEAINELKKKKKNDVYLFFENNDEVLEIKNLTFDHLLLMMNNGEIEPDCYVVNKNFEWTFVYTHETLDNDSESSFSNSYYIGPFFKTLNKDLK